MRRYQGISFVNLRFAQSTQKLQSFCQLSCLSFLYQKMDQLSFNFINLKPNGCGYAIYLRSIGGSAGSLREWLKSSPGTQVWFNQVSGIAFYHFRSNQHQQQNNSIIQLCLGSLKPFVADCGDVLAAQLPQTITHTIIL